MPMERSEPKAGVAQKLRRDREAREMAAQKGPVFKPYLVQWRSSEYDEWYVIGEADTPRQGKQLSEAYDEKFPGQTRTVKREKA